MTTPTRRPMRQLDNFDPDRGCFGCGPDNPQGLRMAFVTDGERLYSRLTLPKTLCGWECIAHGGIVTTVLDEIMSRTAIHLLRRLILTRSISVTFSRPVLTGVAIEVEGWIDRIVSDREAVMGSAVLDASGRTMVQGSGTFALLTPSTALRLGVIEERVIRGFEAFFGEV